MKSFLKILASISMVIVFIFGVSAITTSIKSKLWSYSANTASEYNGTILGTENSSGPSSVFKPGEPITLVMKYSRDRDCMVNFSWYAVGNEKHLYRLYSGLGWSPDTKGKDLVYKETMVIPSYAITGTYHFVRVGYLNCNNTETPFRIVSPDFMLVD